MYLYSLNIGDNYKQLEIMTQMCSLCMLLKKTTTNKTSQANLCFNDVNSSTDKLKIHLFFIIFSHNVVEMLLSTSITSIHS